MLRLSQCRASPAVNPGPPRPSQVLTDAAFAQGCPKYTWGLPNSKPFEEIARVLNWMLGRSSCCSITAEALQACMRYDTGGRWRALSGWLALILDFSWHGCSLPAAIAWRCGCCWQAFVAAR